MNATKRLSAACLFTNYRRFTCSSITFFEHAQHWHVWRAFMECICETRGARGLGAIIASVVSSEHHSLRVKTGNKQRQILYHRQGLKSLLPCPKSESVFKLSSAKPFHLSLIFTPNCTTPHVRRSSTYNLNNLNAPRASLWVLWAEFRERV